MYYIGAKMKWETGRQNNSYLKKSIITLPFLDLHIIKYPTGSYIKTHTDKIKNKKHFRLNIVLKQPDMGGKAYHKSYIFKTNRICLFRPDISPHRVNKIIKGTRYIISLGLAI